MFKPRHIIAASAIAITAMTIGSMAVSTAALDNSEVPAATDWQAKAVSYQSGDFEITPQTRQIISAFTHVEAPQTDELQSLRLTPVTYAHHQAAEFIKSEQICLAQAVYYEARSERRSGQMAVAEVVQNRVKSKHYPNSLCGVVYQGSGRKSGCQFSFTCDGSMNKMPKGKHWDKALEIATFMQTHDIAPLTRGATHYHTTAINPKWSANLRYDRQIGTHKFYRFNFTERPVVSAPSLAIAPPI